MLLLAACGGSEAPPAAPVRTPIAIAAPADGSGDVVVARVNGAPIWASCVAKQGLRPCEDFELLAQAAAAQGDESAPEVAEAADTALVSRLIATDFEVKYAAPSSTASLVDAKLRASGTPAGHDVPEGRATAYLRVDLAPTATPETVEAAHALALALAGPLRDRTGLYESDLKDAAAAAHDARFKVEVGEAALRPASMLDATYANALFALPAVGVVSEPVHTKWGWDVILATEIQPAHYFTRDELVAKLFPDLRRTQFGPWVDGIAAAAHVPVTYADDWKQQLKEQR